MKFRNHEEASLWRAVYAAYVGCNVSIRSRDGGDAGPGEVADRAVELHRTRAVDLESHDPYRGPSAA